MKKKIELRDYVAFTIFLTDYWLEGDSVSSLSSEELTLFYNKWITEWLPERDNQHCGDCIKVPAPCLRCHLDDIFETTDRVLKILGQNKNAISDYDTDL